MKSNRIGRNRREKEGKRKSKGIEGNRLGRKGGGGDRQKDSMAFDEIRDLYSIPKYSMRIETISVFRGNPGKSINSGNRRRTTPGKNRLPAIDID
jgi:hypothetical protein